MSQRPNPIRMSVCLGASLLTQTLILPPAGAASVKVYERDVVIPTYLVGAPEPNPMFYFGRVSQGAEGRVYPYPLYDTLTGRKEDRIYRIVYLENEYVRIGVLPEIGGRIFEGIDKSNGYDFFYRQHVIKPALIGLIGAWISGGVEWNIPHHHRASTFIPVQYHVEENQDGSKTVWVGELELRHRTRWAVGYTLYPDRSYLEARLRLLNRTPLVQSMLCFANVAVHVNDHYQVIFPPRTQFVTHHHKREFTTWPIATTRYGGYDFSRGVDVSWFTNHSAANSMFAWNYQDDFFAGYDHGKEAGLMSVADHHIVPGKKLWTWGNGPRGRMWDKILTDEDGPYIELMVGAYSDNQPDYSWQQPCEVKSFEMYWYPFRDIGGVKHANLDAAVNLEVSPEPSAKVGFCTTAAHRNATAKLQAGNAVLLEERIAIHPGKAYVKEVPLPSGLDPHSLRASLSADGQELVSYSPVRLQPEPMPSPVSPPPPPAEMKTTEELYLAGLRIEQFHNASLEPDPYWEEALRRDPADVRVNTALGTAYLKRARFAEAEGLFRKALERLTDKYTTPKDAESFYYLGVALQAQDRLDEAFDAFYKATWNAAWRAAAYYALAETDTCRGRFASALSLVNRSLEANALNIRALNLKAALLRHLDRRKEALQVLNLARDKADPLDVRSMAERWLLSKNRAAAQTLVLTMTAHPATALETAAEYANAGLWQDGLQVLTEMTKAACDTSRISPLLYYYLGFFAEQLGEEQAAADYRDRAVQVRPDYVFPFQHETIGVLRRAMQANPNDARAPYYLGNLLFDWQPEEAIRLWESSAALDPSLPIVHRNLAIAYSHQKTGNALDKAIASLERAVALPDPYPLHFAELDALCEAAGRPPEQRLAMLKAHHDVVLQRDDALSREISLRVLLGDYDEAIQLMTGRSFEVWEGGALSVAEDWTDAHLLRGHQRRAAGQYPEALADYHAAGNIPENLPTERRGGESRRAEIAYWAGNVHAAKGDPDQAKASWQDAASSERAGSRRGEVDGLSERGVQRYYQALALRKLGEQEKAQTLFRDLLDSAERALQKKSEIDFFASFGEQQSQRSKLALAHYIAGLGHLGLGDSAKARGEFEQALQANPSHVGARTALADMK